MQELSNKTIWLVGASSGIGWSLACKLAAAGNFIIATARSDDKLNDLVDLYPKNIVALSTNVNNADNAQALTHQLRSITDVIDVLIMAQGTVEYEDELSLDIAMYRRVFETNFFSYVNTLSVAKPLLEAAEQKAYVVGMSSLSMKIGFPRAEAYGASKAAIDYFLHSLYIDLPKRKFDVSIVRPGFVATPMTADNDFSMPFLMSADAAAERIIKGMTARKRIISFPRRLVFILSIFSVFSTLWYRYIGPKLSRYQE